MPLDSRPSTVWRRLVSARPNGSGLRRLTFPGSHTQDVNAAISPNRRQIAFERDLNDGDSSKIVLKGARGDHRRVPDLGCTTMLDLTG